MSRPVITVDDIRKAPPGSVLPIPPGAIITDLALEIAQANQIKLVEDHQLPDTRQTTNSKSVIAIGSDHGRSFTMKETLKTYLEESKYNVLDCGAHAADSVDYPDIAYAVAKQVANGTAWRGIIVDGAGIGSCMAANKVPGIRAALCYNRAMALNSRGHNNANVLTLGASMIGLNLAKQIVEAWLTTDFPQGGPNGGSRHERRVNKIMKIEHRFLKR